MERHQALVVSHRDGGGPASLARGLGRFRAELEDRLRWERVSLGKAPFRSGAGDREQGGRILPRGPERVGETGAGGGAVADGLLLSYSSRPVDRYRINELKHSVSEERLEQVREIDGERAASGQGLHHGGG